MRHTFGPRTVSNYGARREIAVIHERCQHRTASSTIDDNRRNPFLSRQNARLILPVIIMLVVPPPAAIAPAARRNAGNFTIAEDGYLAHAYVAVSTNAVVGTDQDGRMFWTKINEDFVRRGGNQRRACTSLKTRFSRTLQHDVNKYIGHLQGALREYHSGWVMADYVAKAVDDFERVEGMFYHV